MGQKKSEKAKAAGSGVHCAVMGSSGGSKSRVAKYLVHQFFPNPDEAKAEGSGGKSRVGSRQRQWAVVGHYHHQKLLVVVGWRQKQWRIKKSQ